MKTANSIFQQQKEAYWQMRQRLLNEYLHRWVAIADGVVVASGESAAEVMWEAYRKTGSKVLYINKVGDEERAMQKRIRRHATLTYYDLSYDPPMPVVAAEARSLDGQRRASREFILDTGSDITILQTRTGEALRIHEFPVAEAEVGGIGGRAEWRKLYGLLIALANHTVAVMVDWRDDVPEGILGRDVLNEFRVTLDGIARMIEIYGP